MNVCSLIGRLTRDPELRIARITDVLLRHMIVTDEDK